jgi:hypothetical protein
MEILVGYKRMVDYTRPSPMAQAWSLRGSSSRPTHSTILCWKKPLRLREKGVTTEVIVVSIDPADLITHLRNGLRVIATSIAVEDMRWKIK